jgi:hypothetical protein
MTRKLLFGLAGSLAMVLGAAALPSQAEAKPKWHKGGHHHGHGKHGGYGGPPPWAPAHGYRRKQREREFYSRRSYSYPSARSYYGRPYWGY